MNTKTLWMMVCLACMATACNDRAEEPDPEPTGGGEMEREVNEAGEDIEEAADEAADDVDEAADEAKE